MTLSEARGTLPPDHLPWTTEWFASWSKHSLAKWRTQVFAWQSARDRHGMTLELSGASNSVMAAYASSLSCDVFFAGELYNQDELLGGLSLPADSRDAELLLSA